MFRIATKHRRTFVLYPTLLLVSMAGCSKSPSMLEMSDQQHTELRTCQAELAAKVKPTDLTSTVDVDGACFDRLDRETTLVTSRIRHNAYVIQQQQTRQLLWMVVVITIAGVLLAGLQLAAGYRLTMAGKATFENSQSGNIDLEAKKLSISSSVSGILVLALSLCFFYVFTKNIYIIQEQSSGAKKAESSGSTILTEHGSSVDASSIDPAVEQEAARETGH